jgi:hypothetical protein
VPEWIVGAARNLVHQVSWLPKRLKGLKSIRLLPVWIVPAGPAIPRSSHPTIAFRSLPVWRRRKDSRHRKSSVCRDSPVQPPSWVPGSDAVFVWNVKFSDGLTRRLLHCICMVQWTLRRLDLSFALVRNVPSQGPAAAVDSRFGWNLPAVPWSRRGRVRSGFANAPGADPGRRQRAGSQRDGTPEGNASLVGSDGSS